MEVRSETTQARSDKLPPPKLRLQVCIQSSRCRRSISRPTIVLEQELTHRSQQFKHQHALPTITTHRFPLHHRSNTQNSKRSQGRD
ncbi:unnamed protein product [Brassica oleracea var. botrytis]